MKRQKNLYVSGLITIPIYFPVHSKSKEESLCYVKEILNNNTISVIHGDIHTWNGSSHPLVIDTCDIKWNNVISEDELM